MHLPRDCNAGSFVMPQHSVHEAGQALHDTQAQCRDCMHGISEQELHGLTTQPKKCGCEGKQQSNGVIASLV